MNDGLLISCMQLLQVDTVTIVTSVFVNQDTMAHSVILVRKSSLNYKQILLNFYACLGQVCHSIYSM